MPGLIGEFNKSTFVLILEQTLTEKPRIRESKCHLIYNDHSRFKTASRRYTVYEHFNKKTTISWLMATIAIANYYFNTREP